MLELGSIGLSPGIDPDLTDPCPQIPTSYSDPADLRRHLVAITAPATALPSSGKSAGTTWAIIPQPSMDEVSGSTHKVYNYELTKYTH